MQIPYISDNQISNKHKVLSLKNSQKDYKTI